MDIREMTKKEVIFYSKELTDLLYIVLSENIAQEITIDNAEKYYSDLLKFTEDGSAAIIGAFDDEKLVGFHWGYEVNIFGQRRMHSYYNAIYKDYRGQRIGSKFYRKLEEITLKRGIEIIEVMVTHSNNVAVQYHLKNGFEIERLKMWKHIK